MSAPARLGVLGGSGNADLPGLTEARTTPVATPFGAVEVTEGRLAGAEICHVSRHGSGHDRLSNSVTHRANLSALRACEVGAVVGLTACGSVDPAIAPGSLIIFDDLHFPSNRLPDGDLCTWFDRPGDPGRAHWIFDSPFSEDLRAVLLAAAATAPAPLVAGGTYGHVDGPRFNTRSEIAALRACGVTAVSQTGGPETVLAGEAAMPYALVGFVTDYANGVVDTPEPVSALLERMHHSATVFSALLAAAAAALGPVRPPGVVHTMGT